MYACRWLLPNVNTAPVSTRIVSPANRLFCAAWLFLAVITAALVFVLLPVWASRPELADRFLVPIVAAWLTYRAWPRLKSAPRRPSAIGLIPLALGAAAFATAWYVSVQVSGRTIIIWWQSTSFILLTLGLLLTHLGWRHVAILAFPLLFLLFSLPT